MLTVRNAITQVQQGLIETISLGLRRRFVVRDVAALRGFQTGGTGSRTIVDQELVYLQDAGRCYRYHLHSKAVDDGRVVITPADRTSGAGRWHRCELTAPYGRFRLPLHSVPAVFLGREPAAGLPRYAKTVALYEGSPDEEEALERIQSAPAPAFLVKWEEDDPHPRSNRPGCFYFGPQRFTVLCVTGNNRPAPAAAQGSPVPGEGPGLNDMIGDLRYVLAGAQLGLGPWVERTEIGAARIVVENYADRFFLGSATIDVYASWHLAEEELQPVDEVLVQPVLADAEGLFPTDGYVQEGFWLTLGPGLTRTPTAGVVVADGAAISYTPTALTFPASKDTYLDLLADGRLVQTSVAVNGEAPVLAGVLRIALVRADASAIILFDFLCPTLFPWRGPYVIS